MNAIETIHGYLKFGSVLATDRIGGLLAKLGNPQDQLSCIHVAGTNGKGSVSRFLYEALEAEGYRCGLYTSPYLEVFNERIEFDHQYISDADLEKYTQEVVQAADAVVAEGNDSPTEFDIVTAIGFLYFARQQADYVILEVGLGGRGDSSNIIRQSLASVICSISLDHCDILGATIPEIAAEKAGIIKPGGLVICGAGNPEAAAVIASKAEEQGAALVDAGQVICHVTGRGVDRTDLTLAMPGQAPFPVSLSMTGSYQLTNSAIAWCTLQELRSRGRLVIGDEAIRAGFLRARQPGRFECVATEPYVLLDGAHNPDGAAMLRRTMEDLFGDLRQRKILLVTGMLADKDTDRILDAFLAITQDCIVTEPDNPRRMKAQDLAAKIQARGAKARIYRDRKEAAQAALAIGRKPEEGYDAILFAGSLYLIGEMRRLLTHGEV